MPGQGVAMPLPMNVTKRQQMPATEICALLKTLPKNMVSPTNPAVIVAASYAAALQESMAGETSPRHGSGTPCQRHGTAAPTVGTRERSAPARSRR